MSMLNFYVHFACPTSAPAAIVPCTRLNKFQFRLFQALTLQAIIFGFLCFSPFCDQSSVFQEHVKFRLFQEH